MTMQHTDLDPAEAPSRPWSSHDLRGRLRSALDALADARQAVVLLALRLAATATRESLPDAGWVELAWSGQEPPHLLATGRVWSTHGDELALPPELENAFVDQLRDATGSLDDSTEGVWALWMRSPDGEGRHGRLDVVAALRIDPDDLDIAWVTQTNGPDRHRDDPDRDPEADQPRLEAHDG